MNALDWLFLYTFPFLFAGMWLVIMTILNKVSGMKRRLDITPGPRIRSSRWGSASINGVGARNCVKIEEYEEGYVIRMMLLFGGGRLWLPKQGLHIGETKPGRLFVSPSRELRSGTNRIILGNRLTHFVNAPASIDGL